jgi:DNA-damage-inducible protein D
MSAQKTEIAHLFTSFEECRFEHDSVDAWRARALMPFLGYPRWREFRPVVVRAWEACKAAGVDPANQFLTGDALAAWGPEEKVFGVAPKNPEGGRPSEDVILTRRAAYLVAMNGDPRKPEVAFAQHYFAAATRTLEVLHQRMVEAERLTARGELKETEAKFQTVLFEHGVDGDGIGIIRSRGDHALFGGNDTREMKRRYGISATSSKPLADYAPEIVIRAKQLGSAITTHNVQTNDLMGEFAIGAEHVENNRSVREMVKSRGIILEDLPPEEDVKKVERRHAAEVKKLQTPDKPKGKKEAKDGLPQLPKRSSRGAAANTR